MDHINNFKFKELWVLLCYHFGSERFKGIQNKAELVCLPYLFKAFGKINNITLT